MRWAYKTVLYSLKKDGFLGDSFLDEEEMERSLNEYGKAGWELVAFVEVAEGFRAIFKYLLEEGREEVFARHATPDIDTSDIDAPDIDTPDIATPNITTPDITQDDLVFPAATFEKPAIDDQPLADVRIKEEKEETSDRDEYPAIDVGSIRIE